MRDLLSLLLFSTGGLPIQALYLEDYRSLILFRKLGNSKRDVNSTRFLLEPE